MSNTHTFRVIPGGGGSDDGPPLVVTQAHLLILSYRRAAKSLLIAADHLEAEMMAGGVAITEEAQAEAVVRALVAAVRGSLN